MPDKYDIRAGARVRKLRQLNNMSQGDLAYLLGISFQQVQKYEGGINRISISRFIHIAKALGVSPEILISGVGD